MLETTEGGTSQDTEEKQVSKGHSLSRDHRERDKSGHRRKATKARGTHSLETTEVGTSQNTERK